MGVAAAVAAAAERSAGRGTSCTGWEDNEPLAAERNAEPDCTAEAERMKEEPFRSDVRWPSDRLGPS